LESAENGGVAVLTSKKVGLFFFFRDLLLKEAEREGGDMQRMATGCVRPPTENP